MSMSSLFKKGALTLAFTAVAAGGMGTAFAAECSLPMDLTDNRSRVRVQAELMPSTGNAYEITTTHTNGGGAPMKSRFVSDGDVLQITKMDQGKETIVHKWKDGGPENQDKVNRMERGYLNGVSNLLGCKLPTPGK